MSCAVHINAEEPEWARSAAEQPASDSEPRCHETQTELACANRVAFLGQLSFHALAIL